MSKEKQIEDTGKWELGKSGCIYFCPNCEYYAMPREAREYFADEYRVSVDNFGIEKHPEKIEAFLIALELIEKEREKEPSRVGLADLRCPNCHEWIPFDRLNGKIENAPKRCAECGQRLKWG